VVLVLLLVQVSAALLAALGELLFMGGNPIYLIEPIGRAVVTFVFAGLMARRRGALVGLLVLQTITLFGFVANAALGFVPAADFTPTLTGLLTGVGLPIAVIVLVSRMLHRPTVVAG
jgi:hypothetical protein